MENNDVSMLFVGGEDAITGDIMKEMIHYKTTSAQKAEIVKTAAQCGLTVSAYSRLRTLGYQPTARLTDEEKSLLMKLAQSRADIVNFTNAINALTPDEKYDLFHCRRRMGEWMKEVEAIKAAIDDFFREIKNRKYDRKG